MPELDKNDVANAVASGKHRYDLDKLLGLQVALGLLCLWVGAFQTVPVGLALLALTLYLRNKV